MDRALPLTGLMAGAFQRRVMSNIVQLWSGVSHTREEDTEHRAETAQSKKHGDAYANGTEIRDKPLSKKNESTTHTGSKRALRASQHHQTRQSQKLQLLRTYCCDTVNELDKAKSPTQTPRICFSHPPAKPKRALWALGVNCR